MKNSYISLAVLSMAAFLVSCQEREFNNDMYIPENGDIVFAMPKQVATKASDATVRGVTIDLGVVEGNNLFLEETITNLDEVVFTSPETKGTPAYTENLGVLYANNLGVHADKGDFGDHVYTNVDGDLVDGGWRYKYNFTSDPWPTDGSAVGFYLRMPATMSATEGEGDAAKTVGVTTDLTTAAPYSGGSITFNYTSPSTAEAMQDILFGYRSVTKSEYPDFLPNGIPVLLRHALTGVKFAIANYDASKNITIKSVAFKGLYDSAECTITPVQGTEANNPDDINEFTSAAAAVWNLTGASRSQTLYSSGTFGAPVNYATGGSFDSKGKYPASFAEAGNTNNLNKADGSQTFWLIPQAMNENITLTIKYTFGSDEEQTWTINFGEILAGQNVEWKAGELHTYTIKIDEVNVRIEDTVTAGTPDPDNHDTKGLIGSKKSAVKITNTGNTDVFIRAAIVGQWVIDKEGERVIMFGFTDEVNNLYAVESWYEDQFKNHTGEHGVFVGLAGYQNNTYTGNNHGVDYNGWYFKDGYYYCKTSVAPGADTPTPLFTSYEIKKIPHARNSGVVMSENMYFTLEISTQAINARTSNGTLRTDWENAWAEALAIDETPGEDDGE